MNARMLAVVILSGVVAAWALSARGADWRIGAAGGTPHPVTMAELVLSQVAPLQP